MEGGERMEEIGLVNKQTRMGQCYECNCIRLLYDSSQH